MLLVCVVLSSAHINRVGIFEVAVQQFHILASMLHGRLMARGDRAQQQELSKHTPDPGLLVRNFAAPVRASEEGNDSSFSSTAQLIRLFPQWGYALWIIQWGTGFE